MNYEEISNIDIAASHIKMKEEYEAIRLTIKQLLDKMDKMDAEYLKGKAVLDKRLQR
tara:strand:- start:81 stop:251 length:171 start_codon:yes stop_codon:yes gene_type:complete